MFTIARFYETSSKLRVYGEIPRVACKSVRIEKPNSGAQLTSQSRQLMFQAIVFFYKRNLWWVNDCQHLTVENTSDQ
jgi:hypothetical protein